MLSKKSKKIIIVGAGPVGTLLGILLSQEGFSVEMYEKRKDPRKEKETIGRSINIALSHRGLRALEMANIKSNLTPLFMPMYGRIIHEIDNYVHYQPYGLQSQCINSVSRNELNIKLIDTAEASGAKIFFEHHLHHIHFEKSTCTFSNHHVAKANVIFGTDGAYSTVRQHMQKTNRFNFSQQYISHGYKELNIQYDKSKMTNKGLHIWPRGEFMFIALPDTNKSFNSTLFLPIEGPLSFKSLNTPEKIKKFFAWYFPDVPLEAAPIHQDFLNIPVSPLGTIKCFPWTRHNTLILGDAAHGIVPFYGQGMNAGFEDVRLLMELARKKQFQWSQIFKEFQKSRKKDTDAIATLALKNFEEMKEKVSDAFFIKKKKLEQQIYAKYPDKWLPEYAMVTFSDTPYSKALEIGKKQEKLLTKLLQYQELSSIELDKQMHSFDQTNKRNI